MAAVPRYSDQKVSPTNIPGIRISDSGASPAAFGAGIGAGLADVGKVVNQFAQVEQEKADTAALMEAQKRLSVIDLELLNDPEKGAFATKGKDAIGVHERILPEWDKRASEVVAAVPARIQGRLQEYQMRRRESAAEGMMRHALQQGDRYYKEEAESTMKLFQSEAITNRLDPAAVDRAADQAMQAAQVAAQRAGLSPDGEKLFVRAAASTAYRGALDALIDDDPALAEARFSETRKFMSGEDEAAVNAKLRPLINLKADEAAYDAIARGETPVSGVVPASGHATFNQAVADVFRTEGGYVANDGGKGETNFGINTTANPGIDIKGLTKAQAAAIYKEKYWDAIGADGLPEAIRGIAFDTAVNQGTGKAREWIKESGGDLGKFMALRKAHYSALIKANPGKYAQYEKGWMARVDKFGTTPVGAVAPAERLPPPKTEAEAMARIDSLYANDLTTRERVRKVASRKWQERNAQTAQLDRDMGEAMYRAAYEASPHAPPEKVFTAAQREWAIKEGKLSAFESILDHRAKGTLKKSDLLLVEILEREATLSPDTFAKRDLFKNVDSLGNDDLTRLINHQRDLNDPAKKAGAVASWGTDAQILDMEFDKLGILDRKGTKEINEQAVARDQYKHAYLLQKQAFIKSKKREPTADETHAMLRDLTLSRARAPGQYDTGKDKVTSTDRPLFQRLTSEKLRVPIDMRASVVADLQTRGIENPSELQIQARWAAHLQSQEGAQ